MGRLIISLLFLPNVPLGVLPHMIVEQFHLLRFPVSSCLVSIPDLQEVLVTDLEPCVVDQNLLFVSISAPPPFQPQASYLEHEVSELL